VREELSSTIDLQDQLDGEKSRAWREDTSITLPSNHLAMLSHPREVAELIEQAAAKAK
jgi:hypothetical protein